MNTQNEWRDLTEEEQKYFRVRYTPLGLQYWQTRRTTPVIQESGTTDPIADMSDTPRTDEVLSALHTQTDRTGRAILFARQLERELNEALVKWDAESKRNHQLMLACGFRDANRFESALDRALQERDDLQKRIADMHEILCQHGLAEYGN